MAEPTSIPLANVPQRGDQSAHGLYDQPSAAPTFAPDADVNVVAPWGASGTVKGKDVAPALAAGYQLESQSGTHERRLQREYGDAPVEAFGAGLLRGGTLGLSDLAARELHLNGAREGMQALQRYNPWASIGGEVVGGFAAPGVGAIGEGAEAAVAGSRFAQELAAGGKAAKTLARYAPALVRGASEGAVFGAGGGLSQAALSDDPITAESLIADVGSGVLLGGASGAVLSGASKFLFGGDAAAMMGRAHKDAATPTIADAVLSHGEAEAGAPRRIGESPEAPVPSGPRQAKDEPFDVAEPSPDNVVPFKRSAAREVPDAVVDDFKAKYHDQDTTSRRQFRQFERGVKSGKIEPTPELHDAIVAAEDARVAVRKFLPIEGQHDGSRTYEQILDGKELGGGYAEGQGKSIASWTGDNRAVVEAINKPGFREALVDHQTAIDHVQELLGNRAYPPIVGDHPAFGAGDVGETMAPRVSAPRKTLGKSARQLGDMFGIDLTEAPRASDIPKAKVMPEAKAPKMEVPTSAKGEHGGRYSSLGKEFESRMIRHTSTGVVHSMEAAAFSALGIGGGYSLGRLAHHYAKEHTGSNMLGYLAGAIAGVPLAMLMSHTIRAPLAALLRGRMDVIRGLTERVGGMSKGVEGFLAGEAGKGARRALGGVLGGVSFAMNARPAKKGETEFQKRSGELNETMGDPMGARRAIHDKLAGVRGLDPMLADQAEELAFNKLQFLHSKLPLDPGVGALVGRRPGWQPSDAEISKWSRYVDTAEHPEHVIEDLQHGTVTLEQVETLRTLYPATYQAIRTDITARAAELRTELSWDQRLTLSTLFHAPTDGILRPEAVAKMQNTFVDAQAEKDAPKAGPSPMHAPEPTKAQSLAAR